jgi:glycosyltransferase involved in cell wall biosynthesis
MSIRVLHVIDSLDVGGAQVALLNLLQQTNRARFDPEVATMHGHGVFWDAFATLAIPVHSLSPRKWFPIYIWRLARLIQRRRPRIIHCRLFGSNWIAKPLAAFLGVPVRINHDECNDAWRHESRLALAIDTFTNRWSSHVCAVSASTRDFLLRHERLAPERVSLVYNGIDLDRFAPPRDRLGADPFVVLGVGRLHPQKNFSLFLDVAADLLRRGHAIRFRIAGTGPEDDALRRQATRLGIATQVEFLGHVSDTTRLYAEADALLMTSRYEGAPLTALEAMAMRLPIVAPRLDGLAEMLTDGVDALLAAPNGQEEFVTQLEKLITNRPLRLRLAESAERKVHAHYSARAMAAHIEAIYDQCLGETTV